MAFQTAYSMTKLFRRAEVGWFILGLTFILNILIYWPGILTSDSSSQYADARSGIYSDHHPAVMAFVWHYLNKVWEGPGLMLLLHLGLFYSALAYGMSIFRDSRLKYIYIGLPLIPGILIYSGMIWKDVGYAFSFMLACMMLCKAIIEAKPFTRAEDGAFWIILFYGTAVKYQAQFTVAVPLIAYLVHHQAFWRTTVIKKLMKSISIIGLFSSSFYLFHLWLVPQTQQSYSWQYVKLYDLSAISVDIDQDLIPETFKTSHFTMEKLHERTSHLSVDETVFGENAILQKGKNAQERNELWWAWAKAIYKHPMSYLNHRIWNYAHVLFSIPGYQYVLKVSEKFLSPDMVGYQVMMKLIRLLSYLFCGHITVAIVSMAYFFLGLLTFSRTKHGQSLLILNGVAVAMLGILFFFSMAGAPRYTYIVMCLTHASHAFAWQSWCQLRQTILRAP